jgi:ribosomal protein L30E
LAKKKVLLMDQAKALTLASNLPPAKAKAIEKRPPFQTASFVKYSGPYEKA